MLHHQFWNISQSTVLEHQSVYCFSLWQCCSPGPHGTGLTSSASSSRYTPLMASLFISSLSSSPPHAYLLHLPVGYGECQLRRAKRGLQQWLCWGSAFTSSVSSPGYTALMTHLFISSLSSSPSQSCYRLLPLVGCGECQLRRAKRGLQHRLCWGSLFPFSAPSTPVVL